MNTDKRHAHLSTVIMQMKDAVNLKNIELMQFMAGYYAAIYNDGYITEKEHGLMLELIKMIEKWTKMSRKSDSLKMLILMTIDEAEKTLLEEVLQV